MRRTIRFLPVLLLPLLAACSARDVTGPEAGGDPALNVPGTGTSLTTDATVYQLREQGSGLAVEIGITLRNTTGRNVYIVNCHQIIAPSLQKRVGGEWVTYWAGITPLCLTNPIVVRPGESLTRKLNIWGAMPNTNQGPAWHSADVPGTYRLVLHQLVHDYTTQGQSFGAPVAEELRVSNEFVLTR